MPTLLGWHNMNKCKKCGETDKIYAKKVWPIIVINKNIGRISPLSACLHYLWMKVF